MKLLISENQLKESLSRDLIPLQCHFCENRFFKPKNQVLSYIKCIKGGSTKRSGKYCSKACMGKGQLNGQTLECQECKKSFYRNKFQINKSENHFCSKSCTAIYLNRTNPERRRKPEGTCEKCLIPIRKSRTYCAPCYKEHLSIKKEQTKNKINTEEYKSNHKNYMKKQVKSYMRRLKERMVEYKGGKCQKCNYNKCIGALEFHHLDPEAKEFSLSGTSISFERAKPELDKCILLCSNCHRETHEELKEMVGRTGFEPVMEMESRQLKRLDPSASRENDQ